MAYTYAVVAIAVFFCAFIIQKYTSQRGRETPFHDGGQDKLAGEGDATKAYQDIEPLTQLDWRSTPPMKLRPFKPKYHLTMGLENVPLSDLIQMDSTYLDRIKLRREITNTHPEATLACNAVAEDAAMELYTWLVEIYLPKRFPTCFAIAPSAEQSSHSEKLQTPHRHLLNKITSETVPLQPTDGLTGLRTLISHVDTDFLILLPRQHSPDNSDSQEPLQPVYHLEAFATTFPSGFSTRSKLSLPLAAIHGPVPRYASKIGKSMDRFFARMETGKMVRRANWTITTTPDLFTQSGTHMSDPDATPEEQAEAIAQQQQDLDISSMRLRTELQTLHRLPVTGALVFAFKTYQYTLEEVKAEGNGEALAEATEGFLKGSVPEMEVYKRVAVWGGKVREYLRS